MRDATTFRATPEAVRDALRVVNDVRQRYQIAALDECLQSCRDFAAEEMLNVAILRRFKAKEKQLSQSPARKTCAAVGAVPVTTVVTEIEYGPCDRAEVRFKNGNIEQIPLECIGAFISETENPENKKQAVRVHV